MRDGSNTAGQLRHNWESLESQREPPKSRTVFLGEEETREDQAVDEAIEGKDRY